jgi:signal transduction histidine kinase
LVSLAFDANFLQQKLASGNHPAASIAERIARYLDHAITESRRLARGLFPTRLEAEGLTSALEELAHTVMERTHVHCVFDCPQPVRIKDHSVGTHLYRIAQEAVNNATRHARPQSVMLHLGTQAGILELRIEDDGLGFPADPVAKPDGMGLQIMRYRAATIGANLHIGPRSDRGTMVSCRVPWPLSQTSTD